MDPEAALAAARALTRTAAASRRDDIEELLDRAATDPSLENSALLSRGNLYFTLGDYEAALAIGEALAAREDPVVASGGWNLQGVVHLERANWLDAHAAFEAALRALPGHEEVRRANARNNLGLLMWRLGGLTEAIEHFQIALSLFEQAGRDQSVGNTKNNLGMAMTEAGRREEGRALFQEVVDQFGDDAPGFRANALANLAGILEEDGEVERAEALQREVLTLRERLGYRRGVCGTVLALARLLVRRGAIDEAEAHLARGQALAAELDLKKHLVDAAELRAVLLAKGQKWEEAYHARVALEAARDSLDIEETRHRIETAGQRALLQHAQAEAARQREVAQQMRAESVEATRIARARSTFLSTASHELRGPLTAVIGSCQLLAEVPLAPEDRELAQLALSSALSLRDVVGDVLDLSRLDAGAVTLREEPLELALLLDELVHLARAAVLRPEIDLFIKVEPGFPAILLADKTRLRQLLANLLENGLKYTESGSVTLSVSRDGADHVFRVTDTGGGIPSSFLDELFVPFARADTTRVRSQEGVGLGLAIARGLAEAMGGLLRLESTSPDGTVFELRLPARPHEVEPVPNVSEATAAQAARLVLLVEDDPTVSLVLSQIIKRGGHAVFTALDSASALELLDRHAFDVAFVDLRLGAESGMDLVRAILERAAPPRVAIVSGQVDDEVRAEAHSLGCVAVLSKPVLAEQLLAVLLAAPPRDESVAASPHPTQEVS